MQKNVAFKKYEKRLLVNDTKKENHSKCCQKVQEQCGPLHEILNIQMQTHSTKINYQQISLITRQQGLQTDTGCKVA